MIRFVNDTGTGYKTRILDAETGKDISAALCVEYGARITVGEVVSAEATILMVQTDITADQTTWMTKHPVTGSLAPVRAIEFQDGSRIDFSEDGTPRFIVS
ncbi:MAG: hypothetical protein F8N39_17060 [Clostridiaceae bacterium]|nr:hypothetical protein [Clostridiaceae bacterium]